MNDSIGRTALFFLFSFWSVSTGCGDFFVVKNAGPQLSVPADSNNQIGVEKSDVQRTQKIQMSLYQVDRFIVLNQPIVLGLAIKNNYDELIRVDLGDDFKGNLALIVSSPDGRRYKLPQFVKENLARDGHVTLKPQESFTQNLILNEWADFRVAGSYVVEVNVVDSSKTENGELSSSAGVAFNVMPANDERLREYCSDLGKRLDQSQTYAEAAEIALTMSYVQSQVVIPYLQKAIASDKMVESVIINSLRKNGGKHAVQTLAWVIKQQLDSNVKAQAIASLNWIASTTSDPTIAIAVARALQGERKH